MANAPGDVPSEVPELSTGAGGETLSQDTTGNPTVFGTPTNKGSLAITAIPNDLSNQFFNNTYTHTAGTSASPTSTVTTKVTGWTGIEFSPDLTLSVGWHVNTNTDRVRNTARIRKNGGNLTASADSRVPSTSSSQSITVTTITSITTGDSITFSFIIGGQAEADQFSMTANGTYKVVYRERSTGSTVISTSVPKTVTPGWINWTDSTPVPGNWSATNPKLNGSAIPITDYMVRTVTGSLTFSLSWNNVQKNTTFQRTWQVKEGKFI